jgi:NADH-quinone oxidoreductase subunit A
MQDYIPVIMQASVAIGFAASMLIMSVLLGKKGRSNPTKQSPYECGMLPIGEGSPRFSVKFYLVAMLFVIFDIEVVFLYPWAVQFKDFTATSMMPFWSICGFVGILAVAYIYALKKGALNWKA